MRKNRSALFRGRHFEDEIIILCVRWYLRYSLSYRDLEEMMAERGLSLDHSTIWRWVQRYAPILNQRIRQSCGAGTVLGEWMKATFASLESGHIYTERWILKATQFTSCCRPIVT
jgi:hypothetical protein